MLKNMKLGAKISLGFAMVICLAAVLGTLGVVSMNAVRGKSNILASEYMPEVQMVTQVERASLLTMYAVRGYALSEEQKYYDEGVKHLAEDNKALADCEQLAKDAEHLVKLGPAAEAAKKAVNEYDALLGQTVALIGKLDADRAAANNAAATFIDNASAYLTSQNAKLDEEIGKGVKPAKLKERHQKVTPINDIIDLGNAVRIANWKAQAQRDPEMLLGANANFEPMAAKFNELRASTSQEVNLQQINKTEEAANAYRTALNDFLTN